MLRVVFLWVSLCSSALGQSATGTGVCNSDGSNSNGCCKPDGTKYCVQIKASQINISDGICIWTNLAGQTPDATASYNAPNINNFACGGDTGNCNYGSTAQIADSVGTAYYGMVDSLGSNISIPATTAKGYYENFNVALSRYNCEEQYSHWNCDDCRKAYARWACAMTMPACSASPCQTTKPCVRVCNEVVQKCPVTLGFTCPDDNRDYADSSCNYMGLTAGVGSNTVPMLPLLISAIIAVVFPRHY